LYAVLTIEPALIRLRGFRLADFKGVRPSVEFDLNAKTIGTCTVNLTEDTGLKRTFTFAIAVHSSW
jgi:hypothetical protein